ncbi:hypothetical protein A3711_07095 [Erythrobacter sp. HI00D59]|nr:hypothetical protein A3711_07095 [Erythrobacter sp. HI00D59]
MPSVIQAPVNANAHGARDCICRKSKQSMVGSYASIPGQGAIRFAQDDAVPVSLLVNPSNFVRLSLPGTFSPGMAISHPKILERFDTIVGDHQAVRSSLRECGRSLCVAFGHVLFLA